MAEITRTTAKTYFNTGDTPTEQQFANVMDSIPFPLSDAVFSALTGTLWDGSYKTLTLTTNTALTFSSSKRSGVLLVKQDATGGRTLSINGTSAPINTGANATSIITFLYNDVTSDYVFSVETGLIGVSGGLDTTAPTLVSAVISNAAPSNLVLTYNEALDPASIPATTDFDIQVNGASRNRDSVNISGSVINIHLTSPVGAGDVVTVSYLAGGSNKIQDVAGNDGSAFINTAVTNNVSGADTTPPAIVSKTATSTTNIRVVFNENVTVDLAGWSFKKNGSALAASSVSGSGTTWDFTVAPISPSDTLLVSYNSTTGATVDSASNELASFTDSAVVISITDSDAAAYLTALAATGVPSSEYNSSGIHSLFVDWKSSGYWAKAKRIYLLCYSVQAANLINLKSPGTKDALVNGTVTWSTTGAGGFSETLPATINPQIVAADYTQDDVHAGALIMTANALTAAGQDKESVFGAAQEDNDAYIRLAYGISSSVIYAETMSASSAGFAGTIAQGIDVITRGSSTEELFYRNGSLLNTRTVASKTIAQLTSPTTPVNPLFEVGCYRANYNRRTGFESNKIGFFTFGNNLASSEVSGLKTSLKTYMTILGTNVIP